MKGVIEVNATIFFNPEFSPSGFLEFLEVIPQSEISAGKRRGDMHTALSTLMSHQPWQAGPMPSSFPTGLGCHSPRITWLSLNHRPSSPLIRPSREHPRPRVMT